VKALPGDGGPCPICGEDMAAKEYEEESFFLGLHKVAGRYWHMRFEHGIMEDYDINAARLERAKE